MNVDQSDDIFHDPKIIRHASGDRGGNLQGLMGAVEAKTVTPSEP